jgi:hypothetical protein
MKTLKTYIQGIFATIQFKIFFVSIKIKVYKTIILLVLYGHEVLSLTLRKQHSLSVLGIRVLSRMFGLRRGSNRKL